MRGKEIYKSFYKLQRKKDAKIGLRINELMQVLHNQNRKTEEERDKLLLKSTLEEITSLRKTTRFRDEFPSFSQFKQFVKKEGVLIEDLKNENQ